MHNSSAVRGRPGGRIRRANGLASIAMLALVFAAAAVGPLAADPLEAVRDAFCNGNWQEAAEAAEREGGTEGYLLASTAWRVHGRYGGLGKRDKEDIYGKAIKAAEEGLRIASADHRLRAALSSGLARRCSLEPIRCLLENEDLKRAREELETALAHSPDNPIIRGALGAWHARAGVAGVFTGADSARGRRLLEEAEPKVGEDIPLIFEMARAWRDLGDRQRAAALYRKAFELPANCAWEREIQKRARSHYDEVAGS